MITRKKVQKAFKTPSNTAVMSMMAIILICAAPALVSVIDDSYTYEGSSEVQLLDTADTSSFIRAPTEEEPLRNVDASYIPASENDGIFMTALNDPSDIDNVKFVRFNGIDIVPLMSGISTVKVVTSSDLTSVYVHLGDSNGDVGSSVIRLTQSESDTSVWTGSVSSVDLVKIKSGVYDKMFVDMYGPNELFDMQIYSVGEYVIPYGEIIIGATGALLIICAILATPWASTSGLTIKRRR